MKKSHFQIFHHRWSLPIIALLHQYQGAKYSFLLNKFELSRSVLSKTLNELIENGLVKRNTGHGHPMRPEYLLTSKGKDIGPFCLQTFDFCSENHLEELLKSKWAIPIFYQVHLGHSKFSEIKDQLDGITARSLSAELKNLTQKKLITRKLKNEFPPSPIYSANRRGIPLLELIDKNSGQVEKLF